MISCSFKGTAICLADRALNGPSGHLNFIPRLASPLWSLDKLLCDSTFLPTKIILTSFGKCFENCWGKYFIRNYYYVPVFPPLFLMFFLFQPSSQEGEMTEVPDLLQVLAFRESRCSDARRPDQPLIIKKKKSALITTAKNLCTSVSFYSSSLANPESSWHLWRKDRYKKWCMNTSKKTEVVSPR